jgi:predicted transcriptional regulator YheO
MSMAVASDISPALKPYAALVEFLGVILGDKCEVLLHDCSDFNRSIVAVANSHISGRSLGGPATDLVLRLWRTKRYEHRDYYANYSSFSSDGREFRSSTFFVRDAQGTVIALLCINQDDGPVVEAKALLEQFLSSFHTDDEQATNQSEQQPSDTQADTHAADNISATAPQLPRSSTSENLSISVDELTTNRIHALALAGHLDLTRLSKEERLDFIKQLDDEGIFLLKGSIEKTASALGLSQPSIYRYLRCARDNSINNDNSTNRRH